MNKLNFKWPMAIMPAILLVLGTVIYVEAKNRITVPTPTEQKVATVVKWYELVPTDEDLPSNQLLASSAPMPNAPAELDEEGCARTFNEGDYCAVAVEFDASAEDFTLTGANLQAAINNHAKALGIASNNPNVDEDEDGYSRKQAE